MTYKSLKIILAISMACSILFTISILAIMFYTRQFNYLWATSLALGLLIPAAGASLWGSFNQLERNKIQEEKWRQVSERELLLSRISALQESINRWEETKSIRNLEIRKDEQDALRSYIAQQIFEISEGIKDIKDSRTAATVSEEVRMVLRDTPWIHYWVELWDMPSNYITTIRDKGRANE